MRQIIDTGATFSADEKYRYALWRTWDMELPHALIIGNNPSTAGWEINDPTIVREMGFAESWGCGGIYKLNAYAYRATDPKELKRVDDPVGPENDYWLGRYLDIAEISTERISVVVAAWGASCPSNRDIKVTGMLRPASVNSWCFGMTKSGYPKHPLYLPKTTELVRFP